MLGTAAISLLTESSSAMLLWWITTVEVALSEPVPVRLCRDASLLILT